MGPIMVGIIGFGLILLTLESGELIYHYPRTWSALGLDIIMSKFSNDLCPYK